MLSATDHALARPPYRRLHPRVRSLWLVSWLIEAALSAVLLVAPPVAFVLAGRQGAVWFLAGGIALSLAYSAFELVRTLLRYQATGYRLGTETLDLASGVWWRSEKTTPYFRVQHVDIAQGPLERLFGLSKLIIHSASAQHRMTIAGVSTAEVEALRSQILANVGRDDGV